MADYRGWTGEERRREERRKILERRRAERLAAKTRRMAERRMSQVCYLCHTEFTPKSKDASPICPTCETDALRGGPRHRPRY
jgi:hypothetical protein